MFFTRKQRRFEEQLVALAAVRRYTAAGDAVSVLDLAQRFELRGFLQSTDQLDYLAFRNEIYKRQGSAEETAEQLLAFLGILSYVWSACHPDMAGAVPTHILELNPKLKPQLCRLPIPEQLRAQLVREMLIARDKRAIFAATRFYNHTSLRKREWEMLINFAKEVEEHDAAERLLTIAAPYFPPYTPVRTPVLSGRR